ncbi:MAG: hypothetical protein IPN10_15290 [Saprospiraceae bacterium]|nr:hypothetical protein [Saprospiraceae bacterium]
MKFILILITTLLLSCTDDKCKNYNLVTESSIDSASDKCDGLANSHPEMKVISSKSVGCLTNDELKEAKKAQTTVCLSVKPLLV